MLTRHTAYKILSEVAVV